MSLGVLAAHETAEGFSVTFITDAGLEPLEGSHEQIARLARVMDQVSVLARLNDHERVWLEDVEVGDATVRFGIAPGGQARVQIVRQ
jgi:DNA-binding IclR family transcriptional regulator